MTQDRPQPKISIIIPCLNEENYVPKLLTDLTNQQGFGDFEVIVVDSNSTDNTVGVAKQFQDKLPLRVISLDQRGVSRARNAGAEEASGEFLLFLDADVHLPNTRFLQKIAKVIGSEDIDFATTHISADGWHPFDRIFYQQSSKYFEESFEQGRPRMTGAIMLVKKELHEKIGGFDESAATGQDIIYSRELAKTSQNGTFISSLYVVCSSRRFRTDGRWKMLARAMSWNYPWWPEKWSFMGENYHKNERE